MKVSEAFPSKYLKADDLQGKMHTVVMSHIKFEPMQDGEEKPVLFFTKGNRGLVLNKTNAEEIQTAYGEEMDDWTGKQIVLYPHPDQFRRQDGSVHSRQDQCQAARAPAGWWWQPDRAAAGSSRKPAAVR